MLSFVQSWFTPGANPVGVDFGTDCLRLAQVQADGGEFRLVAAASAAVPDNIRDDSAARLTFFTRTLRELWSRGNFRGRRAVLALPAASMYIQHLRLPRMDDESLKRAIPWEAQGKIPIDLPDALIRHIVAGDVYADDEPRSEVIVMAAHGKLVEQFLSAAARARVEVMALTVEPRAIIDCFLNIYRRKTDSGMTHCFVDMGCSASRVMIAHGSQILFARSIPIGGAHFNQAVAAEFEISLDDAKRMRIHDSPQECALPRPQVVIERPVVQHAHAMAASGGGWADGDPQATHLQRRSQDDPDLTDSMAAADALPSRLSTALEQPVNQLIEELTLCRRYHESSFPNRPIKRLVFVGGEARQRGLCQHIARELGIGAQVGDPLIRMGRTTEIGIESGIDRRLPQPAWVVALGLSMGPALSVPKGPALSLPNVLQASRNLP